MNDISLVTFFIKFLFFQFVVNHTKLLVCLFILTDGVLLLFLFLLKLVLLFWQKLAKNKNKVKKNIIEKTVLPSYLEYNVNKTFLRN